MTVTMVMRLMGRGLALGGLLALLVGCAAGPGATPTVPPTRPPTPVVTPVVTPTGTPTPPAKGGGDVTTPAVQAAVADLARRRSIDPARVRLVSAEAVEWPTSALGCPEPGRTYLQVITPGWRVTLAVDGQTVVYHTNQDGRIVTPCPRAGAGG